MKCSLCRNQADTDYAVERDKPKPLCSTCFGRWAPKELDALLGVKPPYPYTPMATPSRPVVAGTALSEVAAVRCQSASASLEGAPVTHPDGVPNKDNEGGKHEVLAHGDVFDNPCSPGSPIVR